MSDVFPSLGLAPAGAILRTGALRDGAGPAALSRIPGILLRHKVKVVLWTIVFALPLASASTLLSPHYTAVAIVRVDTRQASSETAQADTHISTDAVAIKTQGDVLKSAALARAVVAKLDLANAPEFGGGTPTPKQGVMALVSEAETRLRAFIDPPVVMTPEQRVDDLAGQLLRRMTFLNDDRSYVIGIQARTKDPVLSAAIANAYSQVFLDYTRDQKVEAVNRSHTWFDGRLQTLQKNLRDATLRVHEMRVRTGLIEDPGATTGGVAVSVAGQQLAQVNSLLVAASADRVEKEAIFRQATAAINGQTSLESIPAVVQSQLIQQLRVQEAQVVRGAANSAANHSTDYPGQRSLMQEQAAIQGRIATEVRHIADSLASDARAAAARQDSLAAALAAAKARVGGEGQDEMTIRELQNSADAARTIYLNYLDLYEKSANQAGLQQPDASLVSTAFPSVDPAAPNPSQLMAASLVVSFLGAMFVTARGGLASKGYRTAEDFESEISLAMLGSTPLVKHRRIKKRDAQQQRLLTDAVSMVRSGLVHRADKAPRQVILVTSALPSEGKTFLASRLARNAHDAGQKTLLIDCDMRRQTGQPPRHDALATDPASSGGHAKLNVMTASIGDRDPQDFFASSVMIKLIAEARERYDLIILDAPPILAFADARVLSSIADSTLLVVRWLQTPRKLVIDALDALMAQNAHVSGAVLNGIAVEQLGPNEGRFAYVQKHYPDYAMARGP